MRIFKWYLVNDIDEYVYRNNTIKVLKDKLKYFENENYRLYEKLERLKKENTYLKNHQEIKIVNLEDKGRNE